MFTRYTFSCSRRYMNQLTLLPNINWSLRLSSLSASNNNSMRSTSSSDPLVTVWWDSSCPLCLREMNLMKKWAKPDTIAFVDIASPDSTCPLDRQKMLTRFHVQERGGQIVHGAEAFALLWKYIPRMQRLGLYLTQSPKTLSVFESVYSSLFLPYLRPAFQRIFKLFGLKGKKYT